MSGCVRACGALSHILLAERGAWCRSAEDYVRTACAGLIHDAVVVGTGRALPCLVVEADALEGENSDQARADLAQRVVERIAERNARVFKHERIEDAARVFVVAKGELPRTKVSGEPSGAM